MWNLYSRSIVERGLLASKNVRVRLLIAIIVGWGIESVLKLRCSCRCCCCALSVAKSGSWERSLLIRLRVKAEELLLLLLLQLGLPNRLELLYLLQLLQEVYRL